MHEQAPIITDDEIEILASHWRTAAKDTDNPEDIANAALQLSYWKLVQQERAGRT